MLKVIMPLIVVAIFLLGAAAVTGISAGTGKISGSLHLKVALGAMIFSILVHVITMFHAIYAQRVIREISGESEARHGH